MCEDDCSYIRMPRYLSYVVLEDDATDRQVTSCLRFSFERDITRPLEYGEHMSMASP